jgi:hypothetical protein
LRYLSRIEPTPFNVECRVEVLQLDPEVASHVEIDAARDPSTVGRTNVIEVDPISTDRKESKTEGPGRPNPEGNDRDEELVEPNTLIYDRPFPCLEMKIGLKRALELEPGLGILIEKTAVLKHGSSRVPSDLNLVVDMPLVSPPEISGTTFGPAVPDLWNEPQIGPEIVANIRVLRKGKPVSRRVDVIDLVRRRKIRSLLLGETSDGGHELKVASTPQICGPSVL